MNVYRRASICTALALLVVGALMVQAWPDRGNTVCRTTMGDKIAGVQ